MRIHIQSNDWAEKFGGGCLSCPRGRAASVPLAEGRRQVVMVAVVPASSAELLAAFEAQERAPGYDETSASLADDLLRSSPRLSGEAS